MLPSSSGRDSSRPFRERALQVPTVQSESVILHIGGALNEHAADDGAVGNRDARYVTGFAGAGRPDAPDPPRRLGPRRAGRHPPVLDRRQLRQLPTRRRRRGPYRRGLPRNFERLRRVKADLDPRNLFRVNRNITPPLPARPVDADPDDVLPPVTAAGT